MEATESENDITQSLTVSMTLVDAVKIVDELRAKDCRLQAAENALKRERQGFDAYKAAEDERESNRRMRDEATLAQRVAVLERDERKQQAYQKYLDAKSDYVRRVYDITSRRLTKTDKHFLDAEKRKVDEAWEAFDKVQKEVAK